MRFTSLIERLRLTAAGTVGVGLALTAILCTTSSEDVTRLVKAPHFTGGAPRCKMPASSSARRRTLVPVIRRANLVAVLRRGSRSVPGGGADDAIQNDAPPIGLAEPCGHSPALEPVGTLSAFLVVARGQAAINRPGSRGPPATGSQEF